MTQKSLLDLLVHTKRIGNLANELLDLSGQMAEALDRNDQVTVRMLIAMRAEPIEKIQVADDALRRMIAELEPPEERERLRELLNGKRQPAEAEQALHKQAVSNLRQFEKLRTLDAALSRKIARDRSIYARQKTSPL